MQCLFTDEVTNPIDLAEYLKQHNLDLPEYRPAVIALMVDQNNKILLQRRGPKSRDEQFKLEDIGGAYEETDQTFRDSMFREIREEVGEKAQIQIDFFAGAYLINKFDSRTNTYVNWLFLLYKCTYLGGELQIAEPGKCLGYEFYSYKDLPLKEIADTTKEFWRFYHQEYKDI